MASPGADEFPGLWERAVEVLLKNAVYSEERYGYKPPEMPAERVHEPDHRGERVVRGALPRVAQQGAGLEQDQ